jgi:hypothetical protein
MRKNIINRVRGVAIFAKACFGHPSPSKQQKLNATANAFGAQTSCVRATSPEDKAFFAFHNTCDTTGIISKTT